MQFKAAIKQPSLAGQVHQSPPVSSYRRQPASAVELKSNPVGQSFVIQQKQAPGLKSPPAHLPVSGTGTPHMGRVIQRAAERIPTTPDSAITHLEQIGAIAGADEKESTARARFNSYIGYEPEAKEHKIAREVFDQKGKSTFAALAAYCDKKSGVLEGKQFDVIDLSERYENSVHTPLLQNLYMALGQVEVNYKNGPLHRNEEGKLPTSDNGWRYIECYYAGGGTRLIIDTKLWLAFVSAHYGVFYVLYNGGRNPIEQRPALVTEIRILSGCYKTNNWNPFRTVYPSKVKDLLVAAEPTASAASPPAASASASASSAKERLTTGLMGQSWQVGEQVVWNFKTWVVKTRTPSSIPDLCRFELEAI